ncbi:MAG: hypothetical protein LBH04_08975 [Tannerellaceae bacterium]|nr:hypothetical protein [Tannerellaceae bacterium]
MKTNLFFKFIIVAVLLATSLNVFADVFDSIKKKEYSFFFTVDGNDRLSIDNRYGSIAISHWSKNEVAIRVEITAKASSDAKAQANLDRVNVEHKRSGNTVSATTVFKEQSWDGNGKNSIEVCYYVSMPSNLDFSLAQKYGRISLPERSGGKANIELKYGKITAGSFAADLDLEAAYSEVNLGDLAKAAIEMRYCGTAIVGNAETLAVDARYSNLKGGIFKRLDMDSHYGNLGVKEIGEAALEFKYGNIDIEHLREGLSVASLDYGNLTIKQLDASFKRISVSPKYANVNISISTKAAFRVQATGLKYGNVALTGLNFVNNADGKSDSERKENVAYTVNGGGSALISFDSNGYSNLNIKAL